MAATSYSIARSAKSGKVFARFEFDAQQAESLAADLSYATTPEAIASATRLRQIAKAVGDYLYRVHPVSPKGSEKSEERKLNAHLREGWRVRIYEGAFQGGGAAAGSSLLGFYLYHRFENFQRIQTILKSLEEGSEEYTVYPVEAKSLRFKMPYPTGTKTFFSKESNIPARKGRRFLEKTRIFADALLASEGSAMEQALVDIIEKGRRFKSGKLSDEITMPNESGAVFDARAAYGQAFAQQRNPLNAVRAISRRKRNA